MYRSIDLRNDLLLEKNDAWIPAGAPGLLRRPAAG
jgi:hypothetical protein